VPFLFLRDEKNGRGFPTEQLRNLLEICISSTSNEIRSAARDLSISILQLISTGVSDNDQHRNECLDVAAYEASCWLDEISDKNRLDEFCDIVQSAFSSRSMTVLAVAQAWTDAEVSFPLPIFQISPMLVQGLMTVNSLSIDFVNVISGISLNCLMYMTNPLPLAALIVSASKIVVARSLADLAGYAETLIHFHKFSSGDRLNNLKRCVQKVSCNKEQALMRSVIAESVKSHRSSTQLISHKLNLLIGVPLNPSAFTRQLVHVILTIEIDVLESDLANLFLQFLPAVIEVCQEFLFHPLRTIQT
jgi:hypothetical protein